MTHALTFEQAVIDFQQEIEIKAAPGDVFEGMLHRLSDEHVAGSPDHPLPLTLERWAGGRWFRDLGDGSGHLWGFVQSIKPPTLVELFGPMFMSYPVMGHMIIRFQPEPEGTRLSFKYSAFGLIQDDHREGIQQGFAAMLADMQRRFES